MEQPGIVSSLRGAFIAHKMLAIVVVVIIVIGIIVYFHGLAGYGPYNKPAEVKAEKMSNKPKMDPEAIAIINKINGN